MTTRPPPRLVKLYPTASPGMHLKIRPELVFTVTSLVILAAFNAADFSFAYYKKNVFTVYIILRSATLRLPRDPEKEGHCGSDTGVAVSRYTRSRHDSKWKYFPFSLDYGDRPTYDWARSIEREFHANLLPSPDGIQSTTFHGLKAQLFRLIACGKGWVCHVLYVKRDWYVMYCMFREITVYCVVCLLVVGPIDLSWEAHLYTTTFYLRNWRGRLQMPEWHDHKEGPL